MHGMDGWMNGVALENQYLATEGKEELLRSR